MSVREGSLGSLNKVWETKALTGMDKAQDAKAMLDRIAEQVKPLLLRRGWRVSQLCEFFPKQAGLLGMNVNRGQKILLRLRRASSPNLLIPYDEVLGTMIHELAHMEVGPHNESFYKCMDKISDELTELQLQGYTNRNIPQGQKVGGSSSGNNSDMRAAMAKAAENRQRKQKLSAGSGSKLGGYAVHDKAELRRRMQQAAERRMRDNVWCPGEKVQQMHTRNEAKQTAENEIEWECEICTLMNPQSTPVCEACEAFRADLDSTFQSEPECLSCISKNDETDCKCRVCGSSTQQPATAISSAALTSIHAVLPNKNSGLGEPWICSNCRVLCPSSALICNACGFSKLPSHATNSDDVEWRTCSRCTALSPSSALTCTVCGFSESPLQTAHHDDAEHWACFRCTVLCPSADVICTVCGFSKPPPHTTNSEAQIKSDTYDSELLPPNPTSPCPWACGQCTFVNDGFELNCRLCGSPISSGPSQTQNQSWYCSACTYCNSEQTSSCSMCDCPKNADNRAPVVDSGGTSANWTCDGCTWANSTQQAQCTKCALQRQEKQANLSTSYQPHKRGRFQHGSADQPIMLGFTEGQQVIYQLKNDSKELATVIKIHTDDDPPYYTIRTASGSEKQTVRERLQHMP